VDAQEEPELAAQLRDETSFRSLLLELDGMEQGLKSDFDDLRETSGEVEAQLLATSEVNLSAQ
jgi:segregation and condensation protein B